VSGEQVEILTVKEGGPSRDWLNPNLGYLKTARARAKASSWFKRQARDENIVQGRDMLEKEAKRMGVELNGLGKILSKFSLKSVEDLYAALGSGDVRLGQVINALHKDEVPVGEEPVPAAVAASRFHGSEVMIQGVGNLLCHFGRCCKPLPGDKIVGFITLGRGVTIHRYDCMNILSRPEDEQRLIHVEWGEYKKSVYPVDLQIRAYDRQGLLRDITAILSNEKINVLAVNTITNKDDNMANLVLTLEISDLNSLMNILNKIMQLPNVLEVHRMSPGAHG
jgi:GTP pyrophosphokinase